MRKFILILFLSCPGIVLAQDFFEESDQFFSKYAIDGNVDYAAIAKDPKTLESLELRVKDFQIETERRDEILAFYCNAYNLLVIKGIIDAYPVKSPMDISGFFDVKKWNVAGESISLNDLENTKIRPMKDPRIHFGLVCAAKGCPRIMENAFFPKTVSEQLEERTRASLNDPYFIRYDENKDVVQVSEIFNWYGKDFGGKKNIISYINQYREQKISDSSHLEFYEYDWALNEKK